MSDFIEAFGGRLAALGRAHEVLTDAAWERAPLTSLLEQLAAPYRGGEPPRLSLSGPEVLLPPRALIAVGMIVHELVTNAVKYGALAQAKGKVAIAWGIENGILTVEWVETGVTGVARPNREGFGTRMIARSVSHDLGGNASFDWAPGGLRFALAFAPGEEGAA